MEDRPLLALIAALIVPFLIGFNYPHMVNSVGRFIVMGINAVCFSVLTYIFVMALGRD